ncbi:TetR family transcriptional regulator [Streptomyces sp. NPDC088354]|uniref:helix-turn-helix domain-containing protein n=1 Tax=unclassified Streptomyces TaxID=2593676 RepID=UPI0029B82804|nr:helix-turn-helix domain-containing protein [Streptomyces sp. MI02-7b]MDX3077455.1 helix-turn-helix domain containing protein [Streptomyces sp. MI02-7b]
MGDAQGDEPLVGASPDAPAADPGPGPAAAPATAPARTPSRAETTRQALLKAAREVFGEAGYNAAGIAEVVRRADASVGGLYHHFDGKADLFLALWEEFRAAQAHAAAQAVARCRAAGGSHPRALFLTGARAYLEHTWARREMAKLFYTGDTPPGFDVMGRRNLRTWIHHNATLLGTSREEPGDRALLIALTTTIAEIGRELVACDNAYEAAALTDSAVELIDGLCDFAPGGARHPVRQPQMR